MRTVLVLLALSLALVALPAAAEAHGEACFYGDFDCYVDCQLGHVKRLLSEEHACVWAGP